MFSYESSVKAKRFGRCPHCGGNKVPGNSTCCQNSCIRQERSEQRRRMRK